MKILESLWFLLGFALICFGCCCIDEGLIGKGILNILTGIIQIWLCEKTMK